MTYKNIESGRSMVEMLGVLAVIGVLSIGGIAGYSYGMDKYRANEATNQIMLRAIDLMTQANQGYAELSLAEWSKEASQYDFGKPSYTNDGLIVFDVGSNNPMPKSVCEIVFDNMSGTAVQIDINKTPTKSNDACADENEMTFYFEGGIGATCDPACPEGQYCDNGICFKGGVPEISKAFGECSDYLDDCGSCGKCDNNKCYPLNSATCTVDGQEGLCRFGECYPKGCTTNDDCTEIGTYCASTNNSSEERFKDGETGSCVPIDFVRREFGGETYYISDATLSWWDAEHACKAIGSNIEIVEITDLVEANTWNGKVDNDITLTAFGEELKSVLGGSRWIWTRNLTNNKENAFCMQTGGLVDSNARNDYYYNGYFFNYVAVCR